VDPNLVQIVVELAREFPGGAMLRSSSNCEDLPGFPSAGLYHSEAVTKIANAKVEGAIRKVWASTYGERAVLERAEVGLNEAYVGMAIPVMPLIQRPKASGVAVTANPWRPDLGGCFINIQLGTNAVTAACGGALPEQVVLHMWERRAMSLQYISGSSLLKTGQYIIDAELGEILRANFHVVHEHFMQRLSIEWLRAGANAVNIEFFVMEDNGLVIVQARPTQVQERPGKRLS
jgi:hypothetical protein